MLVKPLLQNVYFSSIYNFKFSYNAQIFVNQNWKNYYSNKHKLYQKDWSMSEDRYSQWDVKWADVRVTGKEDCVISNQQSHPDIAHSRV